jgi:hypothetical protein
MPWKTMEKRTLKAGSISILKIDFRHGFLLTNGQVQVLRQGVID